MHTIIKKIIKKQGQDVITSKILVNCIDDEGGFSDVEKRPYKKILKLIIDENYSRKLLEIGAWNAETEMLVRTCAQRSLIQEEGVLYVFACLAYGLGWLSKAPKVPAEVKKIKQQEAKKKAEEVEAAQKRNEEVIRKNAEEAARKKAEIAEKRAQEAERRAAEAERKAKEAEIARKKTETDAQIKLAEEVRKKAEAEARIKAAEVARIKSEKAEADRKAAQKVIGKISNLGIIEYTAECRALIDSAYKEYSTLTVEQKTFVTNYEVLTAAKKDYNKLKKAAEEAQKKTEEIKKKIEKRKKESIHRWVFWSIYLIAAAITFNRINEWWEWVISIIVFLVFAIGRYFYHSTFDDYFVLLKGPDEEELDAFIKENKSHERIPEKKEHVAHRNKWVKTFLYIVVTVGILVLCYVLWSSNSEDNSYSNSAEISNVPHVEEDTTNPSRDIKQQESNTAISQKKTEEMAKSIKNGNTTNNRNNETKQIAGKSGELVIPDDVTEIKRNAYKDRKDITSVVIGKSVSKIGKNAFEGCDNLTTVILNSNTILSNNVKQGFWETLPHTMASIFGEQVTTYIIGDEVTCIGNSAFAECANLQKITFGSSVTMIKNAAFKNCKNLMSVEIPNSVISVGYGAFSGCDNLTNVKLSDNMTEIDGYSFSGCRALKSITIPKSIRKIEDSAFYGCKSLKSIKIPNGVIKIGTSAFRYCESLESVFIPRSVCQLNLYAFGDCYVLRKVTIANPAVDIDPGAFGNSPYVTVRLPKSWWDYHNWQDELHKVNVEYY